MELQDDAFEYEETYMGEDDEEGYRFDYVEAIGFVGGVVLAVSLIPQVILSVKERSTADLSYSWQIIYIVGLWLNLLYFVLIQAVAAWGTLLFEMAFAHFLLGLKVYLDGCCKSKKDPNEREKNSGSAAFREKAMQRRSITYRRGAAANLTKTMTVGQSFRFNRRQSAEENELVVNRYRGFHYTVDVRFYNQQDAKELGEACVQEMLKATKEHGIRSVGEMLQVFDGSESPPGFAAAILLDESHMTAHCYSDEGMLAFDCFTCGSNPEGTRLMTVDMIHFLESRFGASAKIEVGHMPRFPVNTMKVQTTEERRKSLEGMSLLDKEYAKAMIAQQGGVSMLLGNALAKDDSSSTSLNGLEEQSDDDFSA